MDFFDFDEDQEMLIMGDDELASYAENPRPWIQFEAGKKSRIFLNDDRIDLLQDPVIKQLWIYKTELIDFPRLPPNIEELFLFDNQQLIIDSSTNFPPNLKRIIINDYWQDNYNLSGMKLVDGLFLINSKIKNLPPNLKVLKIHNESVDLIKTIALPEIPKSIRDLSFKRYTIENTHQIQYLVNCIELKIIDCRMVGNKIPKLSNNIEYLVLFDTTHKQWILTNIPKNLKKLFISYDDENMIITDDTKIKLDQEMIRRKNENDLSRKYNYKAQKQYIKVYSLYAKYVMLDSLEWDSTLDNSYKIDNSRWHLERNFFRKILQDSIISRKGVSLIQFSPNITAKQKLPLDIDDKIRTFLGGKRRNTKKSWKLQKQKKNDTKRHSKKLI